MDLRDVPIATRKRLLKASYAKERNTRVQRLEGSPDTFLISSGTNQKHWYEVTPHECPCQGNTEHGYCQHRFRASYELHLEKKDAPANVRVMPDKHALAA